MSYLVDLSDGPVAFFLENKDIVSPAMRKTLEDALELFLGRMGDHYCLTERFRIRGTSRIQFRFVKSDPETKKARKFRVIASDSSAPVGVLRVLYMDEIKV